MFLQFLQNRLFLHLFSTLNAYTKIIGQSNHYEPLDSKLNNIDN